MAAGDELSGPLATELLDVAREAFTQGMQVAALSSAVVAAATAVLAALLLRRVRPSAGVEGQSGLEAVPSAAAAPE